MISAVYVVMSLIAGYLFEDILIQQAVY